MSSNLIDRMSERESKDILNHIAGMLEISASGRAKDSFIIAINSLLIESGYKTGIPHNTLTAKVAKLEAALCEISNMCIGNLTMSYSLDADHIGQSIYEATGMSNPELNDSVKARTGE